MTTERRAGEIRISGFKPGPKHVDSLRFPHESVGQSYPQHYPQAGEQGNEPLGAPLSIREVARLIGCSAWTVRQSYMPQGLPHLRSGPRGKLIFFRDQVVRWILQHQQKGGAKR